MLLVFGRFTILFLTCFKCRISDSAWICSHGGRWRGRSCGVFVPLWSRRRIVRVRVRLFSCAVRYWCVDWSTPGPIEAVVYSTVCRICGRLYGVARVLFTVLVLNYTAWGLGWRRRIPWPIELTARLPNVLSNLPILVAQLFPNLYSVKICVPVFMLMITLFNQI